ncbi:biopolymer transporter ExbD [Candidatus Dependentiae bacterium]|nr:biopolymer transporter ExbD [Candidatus Dependentiae bacterium]
MNILKRNKKKPNISSASMSDIAFLLIIFFMLTTVFALEQGISYQMPESVRSLKLDKAPIDILIKNNGTYLYKHYGTVSLARAKNLAYARLAVYSEAQAVLRVEDDVKYVHIIDMIDTLLEAGVKKVVFISAEDYPDDFSKY